MPDHDWVTPADEAQEPEHCSRCKRLAHLTTDEPCIPVPEATSTGGDGLAVIIVHPVSEARKLMSLTDQCDRCSKQAYVVCLTIGEPFLLFCSHHYRESEAGLVRTMFIIHDCRSLLLATVR
jgi:hypothetical protein